MAAAISSPSFPADARARRWHLAKHGAERHAARRIDEPRPSEEKSAEEPESTGVEEALSDESNDENQDSQPTVRAIPCLGFRKPAEAITAKRVNPKRPRASDFFTQGRMMAPSAQMRPRIEAPVLNRCTLRLLASHGVQCGDLGSESESGTEDTPVEAESDERIAAIEAMVEQQDICAEMPATMRQSTNGPWRKEGK